MIDYQSYCQIRHLREQDKLTITQIAAALSLERSTVRKWLRGFAGVSPTTWHWRR